MCHAPLSRWVCWVACLACLHLAAQPRGSVPDGFVQLSAAQATQALDEFRHSRLAGDLCLKFEIIHKPRLGESAPAMTGVLWASWTPAGPRLRVELQAGNKQTALAFITTKSGTSSQLWLSQKGQAAQEIAATGAHQPLAPGLLLTPADIYLPFTHWPKTQYVKTERSRGRPVHFYEAVNPQAEGAAVVTFGLDRAYGALVQAISKNRQGEITRTLQVEELAKVDDQWLLGSCSVRDERTRDRDELKFTEAAVRATIPEAVFDPATLNLPAALPAGRFKPL